MADLDYLYTDDGETAPLDDRDAGPAYRSAAGTLAEFAVRDALGRAGLRAIRRRALAVVVECPDASWVKPIKVALDNLSWSEVHARTGASRTDDRPDKGNEPVRSALAGGGRVLGVSQDPARYLPAALTLSPDVVISVRPPSGALLAQVIKAATGRLPGTLPDGLARLLSYDEIVAQIRLGDTAAAAARRLAAASAAKLVVDPLVADAPPFESLVGYGDAHGWGMGLIRSVEAWRAGAIPITDVANRNCVLASEPGLGKSTMVRSLAKSAGMRLVQTSVAAWFTSNGYLDGVIKSANAVMEAAVAASPSLLMLDEIDAIPSREGLDADRSSWWTPVVVNMLLGIEALATHRTALVAVVGATNHPEKLDPALVRPGRLDRIVVLRRPDRQALVGIVRQHLAGDLADEDLTVVGELGAGATGATAAGWVQRARARAAVEKRAMTPHDLLAEIAPPETRSAAMLRRACAHEAGHAVAIERLSVGRVRTVSVVETGTEGGRVVQDPFTDDVPSRAEIENVVVALFAGRAAEAALVGTVSAGSGGSAGSDLAQATRMVADIHGALGLGGRLAWRGSGERLVETLRFDPILDRAVEDDLRRLCARADELVDANRDVVERVAERLARERVIDGDALRAMLAAEAGEHGPQAR